MNYSNEEKMQENVERLTEYPEIITQAVSKVIDALIPVIQKVADAFVPLIAEAVKNISKIYEWLINAYPNKRVLYLAKYHPKERIRKKNMHRVWQWIERRIRNVRSY